MCARLKGLVNLTVRVIKHFRPVGVDCHRCFWGVNSHSYRYNSQIMIRRTLQRLKGTVHKKKKKKRQIYHHLLTLTSFQIHLSLLLWKTNAENMNISLIDAIINQLLLKLSSFEKQLKYHKTGLWDSYTVFQVFWRHTILPKSIRTPPSDE